MIFINNIKSVPFVADIIIPTSHLIDSERTRYDGGYADSVQTNMIIGGGANSNYTRFIYCGGAEELSGSSDVDIYLQHRATGVNIKLNGLVKSQDSFSLELPVTFTTIPPCGQYDIIAKNGGKTLYKGVLQIGTIENNNKRYKLVYNGKQYQD